MVLNRRSWLMNAGVAARDRLMRMSHELMSRALERLALRLTRVMRGWHVRVVRGMFAMSMHFRFASLAFALCASALTTVSAAPPEQTPAHARVDADSIFFNGKVITMDAASAKTRIVQAFAIKD